MILIGQRAGAIVLLLLVAAVASIIVRVALQATGWGRPITWGIAWGFILAAVAGTYLTSLAGFLEIEVSGTTVITTNVWGASATTPITAVATVAVSPSFRGTWRLGLVDTSGAVPWSTPSAERIVADAAIRLCRAMRSRHAPAKSSHCPKAP